MNRTPLIRITQLSKSYGGVRALQDIDLEIKRGEVHAICGENGAGKSTLIKVLAGLASPDDGQVFVADQRLECGRVAVAEAMGIAVMHQESTVFPDLNALHNIFVGRELTVLGGCFLNHRAMRRGAQNILDRLGETLDFSVPVRELPLAQRQIVAMARALSRNCRLLIMDEPTASLSVRETQSLLNIIRQLRSKDVSVLYVSHRLEEIFQIADRVTVLRDGHRVATFDVEEVDTQRLIHCMVGRELSTLTHRRETHAVPGDVVLSVNQLTRPGAFKQISFAVRAGEIVGLGGLVGAGRSEIARAIFGIDHYDSGSVHVVGKPLLRHSVRAAMQAGVALVPEDRQQEGLVLPMSVGQNLSLAVLTSLRRGPFISRRRESAMIEQQMQKLMVRAAAPEVAADTLSGGNQQKLVLGKWLAAKPRVLILDEPTRGIDVGAKAQVHRLIAELADQGVAILVISSELPELLTLCDRICVIRQGRLVGELQGKSATQQQILELALPDAMETAV